MYLCISYNGMSRFYIKFISDFFDSKLHKVYEYENNDVLSYSSSTGKFLHSNLLSEIKLNNFKFVHYVVWEAILTQTEPSANCMKSGVVEFTYPKFKKYCSNRNSFFDVKKVFIDEKLLLPTPNSKIYIINPLYISKMFKIKKKKK
jgi:hypothetical protein